jgi:Tfp pilus assembly protein PilO
MPQGAQGQYHRYRRYLGNLAQVSRQKKVMTYGAIFLAIITVTFFIVFAIKPTLVAITALNKEIKDQKEISQKLDEKIIALATATQQYKTFSSRFPLIEEALPKDTQISLLTNQIEAIARRTGVSVINLRYNQTTLKGEEPFGQSKPISISLVVGGPYENLKSFIHTLTTIRRIIIIRSLGLKPIEQKESPSPTGLSLTLVADTYYLMEKL